MVLKARITDKTSKFCQCLCSIQFCECNYICHPVLALHQPCLFCAAYPVQCSLRQCYVQSTLMKLSQAWTILCSLPFAVFTSLACSVQCSPALSVQCSVQLPGLFCAVFTSLACFVQCSPSLTVLCSVHQPGLFCAVFAQPGEVSQD